MGSSSGLWELELTNPELFKISLSGANPTPSCPAEAARNRSDALTFETWLSLFGNTGD